MLTYKRREMRGKKFGYFQFFCEQKPPLPPKPAQPEGATIVRRDGLNDTKKMDSFECLYGLFAQEIDIMTPKTVNDMKQKTISRCFRFCAAFICSCCCHRHHHHHHRRDDWRIHPYFSSSLLSIYLFFLYSNVILVQAQDGGDRLNELCIKLHFCA